MFPLAILVSAYFIFNCLEKLRNEILWENNKNNMKWSSKSAELMYIKA